MYKLVENTNKKDIERFLKKIWGENSSLSHATTPISSEDAFTFSQMDRVEKSIYFTAINENKEIFATAALKFESTNTIELGSLAILNKYRGIGIASELYICRKKALQQFLKQEYDVITYATLGSNVINLIVKKMKEITNMHVYVQNMAVGVVQISQNALKNNIIQKDFYYKREGNPYNSTLKILATNKKFYYESNVIPTRQKMLSLLLPPLKKSIVSYKLDSNLTVDLPALRLRILIIRNTDLNKFNTIKYTNGYFTQVNIPLLRQFKLIIEHASKYMISTGYSSENDLIYLTYTFTEPKVIYFINKLRSEKYPLEIQQWAKILSS